MRRRRVPAPAAGGASVHRGGPSLRRRPCTGFLAPPAHPARRSRLERTTSKGRVEPQNAASLTPGPSLGVISHPARLLVASRLEAVKARHTGWGVISDDAIRVTRLCSYIACLALSSSSSSPTGRRGLKCATPTLRDSAGRSLLYVGCLPARNTIAPREAYSAHVVRAANSSPPRRPTTSSPSRAAARSWPASSALRALSASALRAPRGASGALRVRGASTLRRTCGCPCSGDRGTGPLPIMTVPHL